MIDLADAHARRQLRLDLFVELFVADQGNAADARTAQGPAAFIRSDLGGQRWRDWRRTEAAAFELPAALFQLQLLQVALLLLLLAQHFLAWRSGLCGLK
jgi:hypothetical protein